MEDLQVIMYIVFGIIYLIFGALKKRRKGQDTATPPLFEEEEREVRQRHVELDTPTRQEPQSLEELLDRYDQAAQRAKRRASEKTESMLEQADEEFIPIAPREPTIRNLEQEALEQMQRTEYLKSVQEELPAKARVEVLQKVPPAFTGRGVQKRVGRKTEAARRFAPYETRKKIPPAQQIKTMLSSKQGFKQAVILTEVLNKKYF